MKFGFQERYFVKAYSKYSYMEIFDVVRNHQPFVWKNEEELAFLLKCEDRKFRLVEINFNSREVRLIESEDDCASIRASLGEDLLSTRDVEYLFMARDNSDINMQEQFHYVSEFEHYLCEEYDDGSVFLVVQTLGSITDDRAITLYHIESADAIRLKKDVSKITKEELKFALIRIFYMFSHVDNWFQGEQFEKYCITNRIDFEKLKADEDQCLFAQRYFNEVKEITLS